MTAGIGSQATVARGRGCWPFLQLAQSHLAQLAPSCQGPLCSLSHHGRFALFFPIMDA